MISALENQSRHSTSAVVFAAGGTGGHVVPALLVAEKMRELYPAVSTYLVGSGAEVETRLAQRSGIRHFTIPFSGVLGKGLRGMLRVLLQFPSSLLQCLRLYRRLRPKLVVAFGGYPAFIPVLAAHCLSIPVFLHEQNGRVGLANRCISLIARRIYGLAPKEEFWRVREFVELGNPVKEAYTEIPQKMDCQGPLSLFVGGGSQGAVSLNSAIVSLIPFFKEQGISVYHQTGAKDFERVSKAYLESGYRDVVVEPFVAALWEQYEKADLIICRAGAMSVSEVSYAGRPAIYVPLPIAGAHQMDNIKRLVELGLVQCVKQSDTLASDLESAIRAVVASPNEWMERAQQIRAMFQSEIMLPQEVLAREIAQVIGES